MIGQSVDSIRPGLSVRTRTAEIGQEPRIGGLVQYVGRILRPYSGKDTAEVHDYYDIDTGVLASSLSKRAPGYISLGFPDPRKSISSR